MIIIGIILSFVALGFFCGLLFMLAVHEGLAVLSSWMCASSGSRVAQCDREGLRFLHSG